MYRAIPRAVRWALALTALAALAACAEKSPATGSLPLPRPRTPVGKIITAPNASGETDAASQHRTASRVETGAMHIVRHPFTSAALSLLAARESLIDPAWATIRARLARTPRPPAHPPILFVHGWNGSESTWTTMVHRFKRDGWTSAELASFSYNTAESNVTTAAIIGQKVDSLLRATGAPRVAIVTHSMGALSARYYVRYLGGEAKVEAVVSLGGPNHGTSTAYACLQAACREMYPDSDFLTALNAEDETRGVPAYATWWSPCDATINPSSSTPLAGATNTTTACLSHAQLHEDEAVYAQVRNWVNQPVAAALLASAQ